ncbi:hypothetical protein ACH41H_10830 [Streptomyces sp. NPDC020800]|uniref:hypothetical protein n=1 Tax=Streptomyces sp. NPDC020800 TaxID=3365092 RepID=UPI0037A802A2
MSPESAGTAASAEGPVAYLDSSGAVDDLLTAHKALLFRGFRIDSVAFADGSPIPAEYIRQVRDRGLAVADLLREAIPNGGLLDDRHRTGSPDGCTQHVLPVGDHSRSFPGSRACRFRPWKNTR